MKKRPSRHFDEAAFLWQTIEPLALRSGLWEISANTAKGLSIAGHVR